MYLALFFFIHKMDDEYAIILFPVWSPSLLVYLLPSGGNRYRLSPQYRKTTNFIFYTQFQQTINKYTRINNNIVRSILLIKKSRDKRYIEKGTNNKPILYKRLYSRFHNFVHPGCHMFILIL